MGDINFFTGISGVIDEIKWFYLQDGKSIGPFSKAQLIQMALAKTIFKETLIWSHSQNEQWKPLEEVFDLIDNLPHSDQSLSGVQTDNSQQKLHPWRRFFARLFDIIANGSVMWMAIYVILYLLALFAPDENDAKKFFAFIIDPENEFAAAFARIFLAYLFIPFTNAAFIGFTGSSLGKWFFGVKIVDQSDRTIGYYLALKREYFILLHGLSLYIPIVNFFTLLYQKYQLKKNKITNWDKDLKLKVIYRGSGWKQHLLSLVGVTLIFFIILYYHKVNN